MRNFKKIMATILVAQLFSIPVLAQKVIPNKTIEKPEMFELKKGKKAPQDGTLFNKAAIAVVNATFNHLKKQCNLAITHFMKKERAQCAYRLNLMDIDINTNIKKYNKILNLKNDEIQKLNRIAISAEKKKNHKYWWAGGGILVGIATTVATVFLVKEIVE